MNWRELLAVTTVGLAMGLIAKKAKAPRIVTVAAIYVFGVLVGTRRPAAGWMGLLAGKVKAIPRIAYHP